MANSAWVQELGEAQARRVLSSEENVSIFVANMGRQDVMALPAELHAIHNQA
jgi:hypothetical protein